MATKPFGEDAVARYDQWYETPWGGYADQQEKRLLLELAAPQPGERVLDVGCGTGRYLVWLRQMGLQAIGVEFSPAMAPAAQQRLTALPAVGGAVASVASPARQPLSAVAVPSSPSPVPCSSGGASLPRLPAEAALHSEGGTSPAGVLIADAHHLPFPDGSFDLVITVTALEFAAHPEQFISEMARVCRSRLFLGVLNKSSLYYLQQRRRKGSTLSQACFFSVGELLTLIRETFGPVPIHWRTTLLGPSTNTPILHTLTRCLDDIPGTTRLPWGAYLAVSVAMQEFNKLHDSSY